VSSGTGYRLCLYDTTGITPVLKLGMVIPPGGMCGTKPCWKAVSTKGWAYKDRAGIAAGITKLVLKGGDPGRPVVQVAGKGSALPFPAPYSSSQFFEQGFLVVVELHRTDAASCWWSVFATSKRNDGLQFKAVSP